MATKIKIAVGGILIEMEEPKSRRLLSWPHILLERFLVSHDSRSADIRLEIQVVAKLPQLSYGPLVFDSCRGLWRLYKAETGFVLDMPHASSRRPYACAVINEDFSQAHVWVREQRVAGMTSAGWNPVAIFEVIAKVMIATRLGRDGGFLLHAAAVRMNEEGLVFTGNSGAGKSTISDYFASNTPCVVLSDEKIILRPMGSEFVIHGTPWPGSRLFFSAEKAKLRRLYCIQHGNESHRLTPLSPAQASQLILRQVTFPHWDASAMQGVLDSVIALTQLVECSELSFLNHASVVGFLLNAASALEPSPLVWNG